MDIPNHIEIELGITNDDEIESKQQSPQSAQESVDNKQVIIIDDEVKEDDTNNDEWNKYKLMTWNLWCIPVSSPRCLSNPDRCSSYLLDIAEKQQWQNYDGLIVLGIQELNHIVIQCTFNSKCNHQSIFQHKIYINLQSIVPYFTLNSFLV